MVRKEIDGNAERRGGKEEDGARKKETKWCLEEEHRNGARMKNSLRNAEKK